MLWGETENWGVTTDTKKHLCVRGQETEWDVATALHVGLHIPSNQPSDAIASVQD